MIWYVHLVQHHLKPMNPNFYCIWLSWWSARSIILSTTDNIFWEKRSKMISVKLNYFSRQEVNEIFSVIYQKIERKKLNKMVYLLIIFQWANFILLVKYYRRLAIFRVKSMWKFFIVSFAIQSLNAGPEMFLSYIMQLFLLYKMIKRKLKKKGILGMNRGLQ